MLFLIEDDTKKQKDLHHEDGFTLIEIIVALAIFGIICVVFLNMFSLGYKGVFLSGDKNKASYITQKAVENYLANPVALPDPVTKSINPSSMTITFPSGVLDSIEGNIVKFQYTDADLTVFMPN